MIEMIKKIFKISQSEFKPYNMIICNNQLHKYICNCECHENKGMLHIIDCCHQEVCPDCKKTLNINKPK